MMEPMALARFVGIPFRAGGAGFDGADCYGLARLYARAALGLDLPARPHLERPGELPADAEASGGWRRIDPRAARPGDVALFDGGPTLHCGPFVDGGRRFLNTHVLGESHVEDLTRGLWRARLRGVWRWR